MIYFFKLCNQKQQKNCRWLIEVGECKTFPENWDGKAPSVELSWPTYLDQRLRPKLYFFRNKTFLFFKIESWNFQHVFEKEFCETSQNFNSFSSFRRFLFSVFLFVVWLSWNFVRFHEILLKQMLKISVFYLEKQKSFIPKKI